MEVNKVIAMCTKVPAALSMLCSGYIAYSISSKPQKRSVPKERIILGLSCSDIIFSFFWFLSTWPMPRGTENAFGAVGNTQTCTMQGFFLQLGIMTPMYNGLLALYCFLYVCRDWQTQQMKYVEIYGHIFVFVFALSTAVAGVILELYNSAWVVCWIEPTPIGCTQSFQSIDGTTTCTRGDNGDIYQMALFFGMIWINFILTFFSMLQIYLHFRKQEKKMEAYTSQYSINNTTCNNTNSDSRKIAIRGALFSGAFLITWGPATIDQHLNIAGKQGNLCLYFFLYMLIPSQGIFNFMIYIYPEICQYYLKKEKRRANNPCSDKQGKSECNSNRREPDNTETKEEISEAS